MGDYEPFLWIGGGALFLLLAIYVYYLLIRDKVRGLNKATGRLGSIFTLAINYRTLDSKPYLKRTAEAKVTSRHAYGPIFAPSEEITYSFRTEDNKTYNGRLCAHKKYRQLFSGKTFKVIYSSENPNINAPDNDAFKKHMKRNALVSVIIGPLFVAALYLIYIHDPDAFLNLPL